MLDETQLQYKYIPRIQHTPGAAPGIEHHEIKTLPSGSEPARVTCMDYSPGKVLARTVDDLPEFIEQHRPDWTAVRWINVDGLHDMSVIHALATEYELHPLAVEDLLQVPQRPKVESYGGEDSELRARLFLVARAFRLEPDGLRSEQMSIFLGHRTVLTFREGATDVWEPIRQRLQTKNTRLRNSDASFLMYSLLDATIDSLYPILESYGDRLEDLEIQILDAPPRVTIGDINQVKRELLMLRRVAWPMREVVATLQREPHELLSETTRVYLRDLYDHVVQIMDIIETYREMAAALTDAYMSSISNRMNQIMKVLTVISTIFIPLTFLAGVYGMNFHHFPELDQPWAYPLFWIVCGILATAMFILFRRRHWL